MKLIQDGNVTLNRTFVCPTGEVKEEGGMQAGDICIELGTGKVYIFDSGAQAGSRWKEWTA